MSVFGLVELDSRDSFGLMGIGAILVMGLCRLWQLCYRIGDLMRKAAIGTVNLGLEDR